MDFSKQKETPQVSGLTNSEFKLLNFYNLNYLSEKRQPCPAVEAATVAAALAVVVTTTILAIPPKKIAPLPLSEETGKNHFPRHE